MTRKDKVIIATVTVEIDSILGVGDASKEEVREEAERYAERLEKNLKEMAGYSFNLLDVRKLKVRTRIREENPLKVEPETMTDELEEMLDEMHKSLASGGSKVDVLKTGVKSVYASGSMHKIADHDVLIPGYYFTFMGEFYGPFNSGSEAQSYYEIHYADAEAFETASKEEREVKRLVLELSGRGIKKISDEIKDILLSGGYTEEQIAAAAKQLASN